MASAATVIVKDPVRVYQTVTPPSLTSVPRMATTRAATATCRMVRN